MTHHHIYIENDKTQPVFLLLHGTGGTEEDLIPLARTINPQASILSVRGNVSENGMNRFFRRLAMGVFDEEDLESRTKELYQFVNEAAVEYEFDRKNVVALGYSNGANIAASMLYFFNDAYRAALLLHPMVPFHNRDMVELNQLPIFIGAGTNDPICPPDETHGLTNKIEAKNGNVTTFWGNAGHSLTKDEVEHALSWYQQNLS